jgi:hypothetical protein
VQCAGSADVRSAVNFARAENLLVAVKCGGHSASGKSTCDGGMMIDLSLLRNIRVDPFARTAHVAGGSLLGEMDHDTMEYGLVTTAGTVSHTGVVTSFKFQLHPMQRQVIRGHFEYAESDSRNALNFFAEYADNAPDDLYIDGRLFANRTNSASVALDLCYSGPHDQADALLAPIRKAGKLLVDDVRVLDYDLVQKMGDNLDPRNASYLKSGFTGVITPQLVDDMLDVFEPHPDRTHMMYFQQSGGAIGRVAENATAFAQREAKHNILCVVGWPKETDGAEHIAYIREVWNGVESHTRGFYVNDMKEETQVMINRNYRGNYDRLVRIKNKYDPGNLFRLNANVQPSV